MGRRTLAPNSAEGALHWWLGPVLAGLPLAQVQFALELLVARQAMRRLQLIDGTLLNCPAKPNLS